METFTSGFVFCLLICTGSLVTGDDVTGDDVTQTPLDEFRADTPRALLGLYDLSSLFLEAAVQPRTLAWFIGTDLTAEGVVQNPGVLGEEWRVLARYGWGWAALSVVSVLATLGVLVAACLVPCCRCCGCCGGGRRTPRGKDARGCYRACCLGGMLVCVGGGVLGGISLLVLGEQVRAVLAGEGSVFRQVSRGAGEIPPYLSRTLGEINTTVYGEAVTTTDRVFLQLYTLPDEAVLAINDATGISDTLSELDSFGNNLEDLNTELQAAQPRAEQLNNETLLEITPELVRLQTEILAAIEDCVSDGCNNVRQDVENMAVVINSEFIFINITALATIIGETSDSGFLSDLNNITGAINETRETITKEINSQIDSAREEVDKILDDTILKYINQLSDTLDSVDFTVVEEAMESAQVTVTDLRLQDYISWALIGLGALVIFILTLILIGSLHIFCSPRKSRDKSGCHVDRATGADWLFAGIGFIFIFYWLLSLITLPLYLTGGLTHTEICRYLVHPSAPQYAGARDVINNLAVAVTSSTGAGIDLSNVNTTFFQAYTNCEEDQALYTALNLASNGYNISAMLDITEIQRLLEEFKGNVDIQNPDVLLLPPELQEELVRLDDVISDVDVSNLLAELSKNVTDPADLDLLAANLDRITHEENVTEDLNVTITDLRNLSVMVQEAEQTKYELFIYMSRVNGILGNISFSGLMTSLNYSQYVINDESDVIIGRLVNETADAAFVEFEGFIDNTVEEVETELGRCYPLYHGLATMVTAGCVSALYPLTGLGFALGWSLLFLLLILILAFKMADHMRRRVDPGTPDGGATSIMAFNSSIEEDPMTPLTPVTPGWGKYDPSVGMPPQVNPAYQPDHVVYKVPRATAAQYHPAHAQTSRDYQRDYPRDYRREVSHDSPPPRYEAAIAGGAKVMYTDDPVPDY